MTASTAAHETVAIEEGVHGIYKLLTGDSSDPVNTPFRTMKDVFVWAACLGFKLGSKRELDGKRTVIFRWAQFSDQADTPLLKALAIAHTGNVEVLADKEEVLRIAEEYANAGIHELNAKILQESGQPLWNLIALLSA